MTRKGAVAYARELVGSSEIQDGLKRLHTLNRLDLSIEHLVANDSRFRGLFTELERQAAQWRLDQVAGSVGRCCSRGQRYRSASGGRVTSFGPTPRPWVRAGCLVLSLRLPTEGVLCLGDGLLDGLPIGPCSPAGPARSL